MLTIHDVITELNLSRRTVFNWIKKGILHPTSSQDSLQFSPDEIEKVRRFFNEHVTTREAALILEVPMTFLNRWIENNIEGGFPAHPYLSNATAIPKAWIDSHRVVISGEFSGQKKRNRNTPKEIKGRELNPFFNGYRLFDRFDKAGDYCWIVDTDPFTILSNGKMVVLDNPVPEGNSEPCLNLPYAASKGAVRFRIPFASLDDRTLQMLGIMVHHFGTKNIRVFAEQDLYLVVVRSGMVLRNREFETILKDYVVEGQIFSNDDGIVIGDFVHRLTISLHYSEFQKLHKETDGHVHELISKIVRNHLNINKL